MANAQSLDKTRIVSRGMAAQLVIDVADDELAQAGGYQKVEQRDRVRATGDSHQILPLWRESFDEFL